MNKGQQLYVDEIVMALDLDWYDENKILEYLYTKENAQYVSHYFQTQEGQVVVIRVSKFRKAPEQF